MNSAHANRRGFAGRVLAAAVSSLAIGQQLFAGNASWIGSANIVDAWATGTNWDSSAAPGNVGGFDSTDTATFGGTPTSLTISIDAGRNIGNIIFDNTSSLFTIGSTTGPAMNLTSGGALTLNNTLTPPTGVASIRQNIAAPLVIDRVFSMIDNVSASAGGGLTINGGVTGSANGPAMLILDGTDDAGATVGVAQVTSIISDGPGGSTSVVKNGTGTWELRATTAGPNTYSGDTIVNAGILRFSTNLSVASISSRIIINGPNATTGSAGGRVQLSSNGQTLGPIIIEPGGQLTPSNAQTTASLVPLNMGTGPAITLDYGSYTGGPTATAASAVILAGSMQYQGGLKLIVNSASLSSMPLVDYGATSTPLNVGNAIRPFDVPRGNTANAYDLRVRGPVEGGSATGGIQKIGSGILRFDNTAIGFLGTLEVTEGQVIAAGNNQFTKGQTLLIDGPTGDFHINNAETENFSSVSITAGTISGSNDTGSILAAASYGFNVPAGVSASVATLLSDSGGPSILIKDGAGTAYITSVVNYTGPTTVVAGTLSFGNGGTKGTFNGTVVDNAVLAFAHSNSVTFNGTISGSGSVAQNGSDRLTLTANNSYAGGTLVNTGTAAAATDGNLGAIGGAITLNNGTFQGTGAINSARNIVVNGNGGVTLANAAPFSTTGSISGTGNLLKTGVGALTVANFHLGGLNISAGSVTVSPNGALAAVTSALTVGDNSASTTAKLDLNDNDMIVKYSGSSPIATVRNLLIAGYNGGAWNGNGITSTVAQSHAGQALGYGEATDLGIGSLDGNAISGTAVIVKYTYNGDSSLDGKVDIGNDFNLFLQGFLGLGSGWEFGDYNYSGATDVSDFQMYVDGFSTQGGALGDLENVIEDSGLLSASQKASLLSAVPEPSGATVLLLAACGLARQRRRMV